MSITRGPRNAAGVGALVAAVVAAAAANDESPVAVGCKSASELPAEDSSEVDANTQLRTEEQ